MTVVPFQTDPATLRRALDGLVDQICETVDGNFDVYIETESRDEDVQRLAMLINSLLENVRSSIRDLEVVQADLETRVVERTDQLELVLDGTNDGVWIWDLEADTIYFSKRWRNKAGLDALATTDPPSVWFDRVHHRDIGHLRRSIKAHLDGLSNNVEAEYRLRHADGTYRWMLCRAVCRRDGIGTPTTLAGAQTDITERRLIDSVTGQPNETCFRERLHDLLEAGQSRSIILLAIDRFNTLLEAMESRALYRLLNDVCAKLLEIVPTTALVARFSSGTFAIMVDRRLPSLDHLCERIVGDMRRGHVTGPAQMPLTVSLGAVHDTDPHLTVDTLLTSAWTALRQARASGGNQAVLFTPELREISCQSIEAQRLLRDALDQGRIEPVFQPIVDMAGGALRGFESLARIRAGDGSVIGPGRFIPVAEETGMIVELGAQMLQRSASLFRTLQEKGAIGADVFFSVNVAANQFSQDNFVHMVLDVIDRTGVDPRRLKLEVTESALINGLDLVLQQLTELRRRGIRIALDDFGTGYSSLSYLRHLPVDTIKIDQSFVSRMRSEQSNQTIVQTICGLARMLSLDLIAEGVEEQSDADLLAQMGVQLGQGYLFSRPLDRPALKVFLDEPPDPVAVTVVAGGAR